MLACGRAVRTSDALVATLAAGGGNWATHVQAFQDLNAGRIDGADAAAEWERTERAAPSDVSRFRAATRAYQTAGGGCTRVATQVAPAEAEQARACADRAGATAAAVASGRPVMGQWAEHNAQAAQRRDQLISDTRANALFSAAVRTATGRAAAFQNDLARLRAVPACDVPGA